jgi:hypothetical protein
MIKKECRYKDVWYYYAEESAMFKEGWHVPPFKVFSTEKEAKAFIDKEYQERFDKYVEDAHKVMEK